MQIDATPLSLPDGECWIYFVLGVTSRMVLASRVAPSLRLYLAMLTLDKAVAVLRSWAPRGHPGAE